LLFLWCFISDSIDKVTVLYGKANEPSGVQQKPRNANNCGAESAFRYRTMIARMIDIEGMSRNDP